jgi:hypothetical protein
VNLKIVVNADSFGNGFEDHKTRTITRQERPQDKKAPERQGKNDATIGSREKQEGHDFPRLSKMIGGRKSGSERVDGGLMEN